MDAGIVAIGVVGLLSVVDLWLTLPAPSPAEPRPGDWRCPFCHQRIADGTPRVRCTSCGTRHHRACWQEHRGCSVFGCGSLVHRAAEPPAASERQAEADPDPLPDAPAVQPVPAAAADPAG